MNSGVMFQYFEWNSPTNGSLWRELAGRARELHDVGATAVWMPPAYKGLQGPGDTGYGTYDLYDLGEFDQKGSVRTKYGTKDEFLAAVNAVQQTGMHAYADVVFNHRMGGDETEEVEIEEVDCNDRNRAVGPVYKIKAWSHYKFPGRGERYSPFKWHWRHFNAFGANADAPDEKGKIYRVKCKPFSDEVCKEFGNFDYLMGADVDLYNSEVRDDLFQWGRWIVDTAGVEGFRLDAVKHIPASFYKDWFNRLRVHFAGRELFGVGEYWSGDVEELKGYLKATDGVMRLFDVPLHFRLHEAAQKRREYDLSKIFDCTLAKDDPGMAVTFVDNHDSQPGQSLQSWVDDWFKPLAYALILLRKDGYPCVFYGDYYGNADERHKLTSHRKLIDLLLKARAAHLAGDQHDYFDHPACVGWVLSGNDKHVGSMAVLMSNADAGSKKMRTFASPRTYRDVTGNWPEPITTDENGEAEFRCPPEKVSVWCEERG